MTSIETATFGAGCFWGVEHAFRRKFGSKLKRAEVGYAGGDAANPNYKQVCTGTTGHAEVLQVDYNPAELSFEELVDFFYRSHDPTTLNRQGGDKGTQYRSSILFHNEEQRVQAQAFTDRVRPKFGSAGISTIIEPVGQFWKAEDYHQLYLDHNPEGYQCPTHFERSWEKIEASNQ
ncbi:peptide methionine sulfoxide reductase MsrA [Blyttiomyces helicus]|uniref:peptide-methionine (S)-S-oxide reductase n=1 Tax=Blyttiomyces helicus TaxID=388810 RepID=A0A4P9W3R4_9FUNG|nr:peptide methionine sulfoxide reductase MsrA [Blyttiomyces helicus]|eukprot:RKO84786.1 peptide methionine sulfoxide reductase MsrA [Blyttiomyces helicus]